MSSFHRSTAILLFTFFLGLLSLLDFELLKDPHHIYLGICNAKETNINVLNTLASLNKLEQYQRNVSNIITKLLRKCHWNTEQAQIISSCKDCFRNRVVMNTGLKDELWGLRVQQGGAALEQRSCMECRTCAETAPLCSPVDCGPPGSCVHGLYL